MHCAKISHILRFRKIIGAFCWEERTKYEDNRKWFCNYVKHLIIWTSSVILCTCIQCMCCYSRARLIRMANARKNHANYSNMQIIRAYFTLCFYQWQRVVSRASMRIKRGVWISEGQIIRVILYLFCCFFSYYYYYYLHIPRFLVTVPCIIYYHQRLDLEVTLGGHRNSSLTIPRCKIGTRPWPEQLTPVIHYAQVTESTGDGASTLALTPMGEVNRSLETREHQWLHKMVTCHRKKLKNKKLANRNANWCTDIINYRWIGYDHIYSGVGKFYCMI